MIEFMMGGHTKKYYRLPKWREFRAEMLERDAYMCSRCKRSQETGVVLQIHHKLYIAARKPWEYQYNDCEVLCRGCHGELHGKVRPSIGWECFDDEDLCDLCGNCELCGTELRYLFYVSHPHWEPMEVGTVCCDKLTATDYASRKVNSITNYRERSDRFVSSKRWRNECGVPTIKQKGFTIQIMHTRSAYIIRINGTEGKQVHQSQDDAKRAVYKFIESGKADEFFRQHRVKGRVE